MNTSDTAKPEHNPSSSAEAERWLERARLLYRDGKISDAQAAITQVLKLSPQHANGRFLLAQCAEQENDYSKAETLYKALLAQAPGSIGVLTNLGNLLHKLGRTHESIVFLKQAYEAQPNSKTATNLVITYMAQASYANARAIAERQIKAQPEDAYWYEVLASIARYQNDVSTAAAALEQAIQKSPQSASAWYEWGLINMVRGDHHNMRMGLDKAILLAPDWERVQWASAMAVPALVPEESEIDLLIQKLSNGLSLLEQRVARYLETAPMRLFDAAGSLVTFNLQFLPRDTTTLQIRFGRLVHDIAKHAFPQFFKPCRNLSHRSRIRVGFVSPHWSTHTVSRYFSSLVKSLDVTQFERYVWHLGPKLDDQVSDLSTIVDHFKHAIGSFETTAQSIQDAELDVLVFADIGMHVQQHLLAAMRLAPCQAAFYGHPATTGLPSVDVFFSGEAFEPEDADQHYSERLIRLPGIGAVPQKLKNTPDSTWFKHWRDERPTLLCLQNLSKLVPAFDRALAQIVQACGAHLVFFDRGRDLAPRFLQRLQIAFSALGLSVNQNVSILPEQPYERFLGAIQVTDLVLDTPWFSGGATSLDVITIGTPIVAWEMGQARGRQTAGMLRLLDANQWIAHDEDSYVNKVLTLVHNEDLRLALGRHLHERADRLFINPQIHLAFANTLQSCAKKSLDE